jgi:hypothetical protein
MPRSSSPARQEVMHLIHELPSEVLLILESLTLPDLGALQTILPVHRLLIEAIAIEQIASCLADGAATVYVGRNEPLTISKLVNANIY